MGWVGADAIAETSASQTADAIPATGPSRSGLATIYAGDKSVTVSFETVGAYPAVQVTPYGMPTGGFGVAEVTDVGFRITLLEAQTTDITFAWSADALAVGGKIDFSDGTSALYDQTTGQPLPGASEEEPADAVVPPSSDETAVVDEPVEVSLGESTSTPPGG